MAKFLIEVNEDGITHEEIVDLLTEETPDTATFEVEDLKVTQVRDDFELPTDAVYLEEESVEDPDFPSNAGLDPKDDEKP